MGLMERLTMAMDMALGRRKAVIGLWTNPKAWTYYSGGGSFQALSQEFYEKNALVYGCVEELATSAAEPRLVVEQRTRNGWAETEEHALALLLERPNPRSTAYEFWHDVTMFEAIAGEMYYEKERSRAGRVVALWPVWPDRVKPLLAKTGRRRELQGWRVTFGSGDTEDLKPDDVLQFKNSHPRKELEGLSPLEVVMGMAGVDKVLTDYVGAFFDNGAVPFGLLVSKQRVDEAEVKRIRKRFHDQYAGKDGWHNVMVLDEQQVTYEQVGLPPGEVEMPTVRAVAESRICTAFQVPPILVGALVGLQHATYSNYREARESFWQETLMPVYTRHADIINLQLAPEFGSDVRVRWDFSTVKALQEDETKLHLRIREDFQAGYITVNEAREAIGASPVADGDIFLRPMMTVSTPALLQGAKSIPVIIERPEPLALKAAQNEAREMLWWKALDTTARAFEPDFKRAASLRFQDDQRELLAMLRKIGKASKDAIPFTIFEQGALEYLLKVAKEDWRTTFIPLFQVLLGAQAENIAATFGISFDVELPEVQAFLDGYSMQFSEALFEVDAAKVNELVAQAQTEGWSVPELRAAINETWEQNDRVRAEGIARTETIRSSNAGATEAMRLSGVKVIRWWTAQDDRTCPWCMEMHNKVIDIGRNWYGKGDEMMTYDAEGNGHGLKVLWDVGYPPLHVNCRCTVLAEIEEV